MGLVDVMGTMDACVMGQWPRVMGPVATVSGSGSVGTVARKVISLRLAITFPRLEVISRRMYPSSSLNTLSNYPYRSNHQRPTLTT